jgi:hypothetical protein
MNKSESIKELATALCKAQSEMKFAVKDAANPFFKSRYADLASVIEAVKLPFANNGISFVQGTDFEDTAVIIETMLMHSSGEWLSSRLKMQPVKNDPQSVGSAITYGKRYGLQAIAGVPSDDDDGNAATHQSAPAAKPAPAKPMPAKVKEAAAALKPHAKGTISGDPLEGDLTGIGPDRPADEEIKGRVIHAYASIGFTLPALEKEYGKPMADWMESDIPDLREMLRAMKIEQANAKTAAAEMSGDGVEI